MPSPKSKPGRPSIYNDARGAIRDGALDLFAERGFEAASINDIAKAAGVPKANVLYYFSDKEELWKEAVDHHWAEVDHFYSEKLPANLPVTLDGLRQFLVVYLEACVLFPPYVQIMNLESHAETWRTRWLAEKHLHRHVDAAMVYFNELQAKGIVTKIDPFVFQGLMTGGSQLFIGQFQLWKDSFDIDTREEDFRERYASSLITLLKSD